MKLKLLAVSILFFLVQMTFNAAAQTTHTTYKPIEAHLQIKSIHLWRGLEITTSPYLLGVVNFTDKSGRLKVGARGSSGWNGEYRQLDYFASYQYKNARIVLYDIFNSSKTLPLTTNLFDYSASTTRHFIDATIGYTISKKFPLDIAWSTIIAGRDRDVLPGDSIAIAGKDPLRRGKNRYSTYVQLTYPVNLNDVRLDFFIGGVFTLNGQQNSFYGNKPGIATLGVAANKKVTVGKYSFPVSLAPTWNPIRKTGGLVVGVSLF
ncbi:hypothetical protein [Pedobacter hiemivivus]|uniref:Transporter n=1 Tax=Pedobacter hiemivivus TaxID=2530454 RepID=A0A4R0NIM4_9SPHI|nr:hypothetical protein [Pedobacter hiemivivus]TCC99647.1 hypothetical protein EZ444_02965 [Pedobacter hiemivivus]